MEQKEKYLFYQEDSDDSMLDIGAGFRMKKISDKHIEIYSFIGFYKTVELKEQIDTRLLVVELVKQHNVKKNCGQFWPANVIIFSNLYEPALLPGSDDHRLRS